MFGSIGFSELFIIAAIALLVLGPEQFPKYAKMAARFVRDLKAYANEVQTEITKELNPLSKDFKDLRKLNPEKYLDKLIAEDEADTRPPNPEPHPSEMNFGNPTPPAAEPAPNPTTVTYGGGSGDQPKEPDAPGNGSSGNYPQEPDVPATPSAMKAPERLDG